MKPNPSPITKALIYCRVSTERQKDQGHGLDSQEHRCRQYADAKGYSVEAVFPDHVSGGGDFMKRPGMVALLSYLDAQAGEQYVVIFDDLKRYARDTEFHLRLRREMESRGAKRECLNFNFEDSPEGRFVETILAAQGELEREQNRRQVIQKMRARVEQGFYCFHPPVGYRFAKHQGGGKILVPDEPEATVIRDMFEALASGHLRTPMEVKHLLDQSSNFRPGKAPIPLQSLHIMLRSPLYAGYISIPKWGIRLLKGKHSPLISFGTWQRVQERLNGRAHTPARKDISADFPLRGAVACGCCGKPLTACWSQGRAGRYPYYLCQQKGCAMKGRAISRDVLHAQFSDLLRGLSPAPSLLDVARSMFRDRWHAVHGLQSSSRKAARDQAKQIDKQIEGLGKRLVSATSPHIIAAYEEQIDALGVEKIRLEEVAAGGAQGAQNSFDACFQTGWAFLSNPWKLWDSGDLIHRRLLLRLALAEPLPYDRDTGFQTASRDCFNSVFRVFCGSISRTVEIITSVIPPRTSASASDTFWQHSPQAPPCVICSRPTSADLWVLA